MEHHRSSAKDTIALHQDATPLTFSGLATLIGPTVPGAPGSLRTLKKGKS